LKDFLHHSCTNWSFTKAFWTPKTKKQQEKKTRRW
jgi:hypothetical protein